VEIEAKFRLGVEEPLSFKYHLERTYPILRKLKEVDPNAKDWLLQGETREEAFLYAVYEKDGSITKAAEAVLETLYRNKNIRSAGLWNGEEDKSKSVSSGYAYNNLGVVPSNFSIEYPKRFSSRLFASGISGLHSLVSCISKTLNPACVSVAPRNYFSVQVFKDRPGVGWMLYLPRVLTAQQVPEARAIVPVTNEDEKGKQVQIGTIIVSVTDEPFSDENPEHVKIANAIEIRLVDQDLLPLYSSL